MNETPPLPASQQNLENLLAVYARARRYAFCRARAQRLQRRTEEAPGNLAEAIERDFLTFELEEAAHALCAAVRRAEEQTQELSNTAELTPRCSPEHVS